MADHGAVTLAQARALAFFYDQEAGAQLRGASGECRRRAHALETAIAAAWAWRRAAGWSDPDLADQSQRLNERRAGADRVRGKP